MLPPALADQAFVVIDLETTGTSALDDRVIEIAALRVRNGRVEDGFDALVDPQRPVPPFVARLTGITQQMVAGRPLLVDLLPRLRRLLDGAVPVGHNALFDHGFLRAAFVRAGQRWEAEWLCTLRLARRLLPGLRRYSLDALIEQLGLRVSDRHRARPDAEATAAVLARLLAAAAERGVRSVGELYELQAAPVGRAKRVARVDEAVVQALPEGPGVYLFKDERGQIVYVGKSNHVRQRVRDHLRGGSEGQPRLQRRLKAVVDVDAIATGSELEALLLESRLIKEYLPEANVLQRGYRAYPFIQIDRDDPFPRIEVTRDPQPGALVFGPFHGAGTIEGLVELLQRELGLRSCDGPIRPGQPACLLRDLKRCLAPCVGDVDQATYRQAVERAVALLSGRDLTLIERLEARMHALAAELRFEAAAELRDRIADLRRLIGAQERLQDVAQRNLLVLAPSAQPGAYELLLVRRGRLAGQLRITGRAELAEVRAALRLVYSAAEDNRPVRREEVDEMAILESWLRQHGGALAQVPVPPGPSGPDEAVERLAALLA